MSSLLRLKKRFDEIGIPAEIRETVNGFYYDGQENAVYLPAVHVSFYKGTAGTYECMNAVYRMADKKRKDFHFCINSTMAYFTADVYLNSDYEKKVAADKKAEIFQDAFWKVRHDIGPDCPQETMIKAGRDALTAAGY